jgi:small GTP-binding protein
VAKKQAETKAQPDSPVSFRAALPRKSTSHITRVSWSPDGKLLLVPNQNGTVEIWDFPSCKLSLEVEVRQNQWITDALLSPDGKVLAASAGDGLVRLFRMPSGKRIYSKGGEKIRIPGTTLAWSPDAQKLVAAKGIAVSWYSRDTWQNEATREWRAPVTSLAIGRTGGLAVCCSDGSVVVPEEALGHFYNRSALSVTWSPTDPVLAIGYGYGLVRLIGRDRKLALMELEGHTKSVRSVSISADGSLLASKSDDGSVKLWDLLEFRLVHTIDEPYNAAPGDIRKPGGIAFHPKLPVLATLDAGNHNVRLWDVTFKVSSRTATKSARRPADRQIRYTTAKIVLVGDSGVGKTGLGWRLSHGEFKEHASTHGQQFWVLDQLHATRSDGTECEAVLWDLAGQADYRLTHALSLDRVDCALILFDPGNQTDPLKGVRYWLNALDRPGHKPVTKILVAARADRAASTLTESELGQFCQQHGISGYVATSAKAGTGTDRLLELLEAQVRWDEMTATTTTATFKRIKDFVLNAKQNGSTKLLLSPAQLEQQLHAFNSNWKFTTDEMMTAVHHLANHGYVSVLPRSSGEQSILIFPEVQSNLAASFVLEARRHPNGFGSLEENRLLSGGYKFPELADLSDEDRETLLDSTVLLFLSRNVCFRERHGSNNILVFPALINQRKPTTESTYADDVSYVISGPVENVYAALVVLLGYTNTFTRTNHWQNQAEYEMNPGEICGFRQMSEVEGEIELVHYYSPEAKPHVRALFQALFESFLGGRDLTVQKYPPVSCPACGELAERTAVVKRLREKKTFLFCNDCGTRIQLAGDQRAVKVTDGADKVPQLDKDAARLRTAFEAALSRLKSLIRERRGTPPSCFISYAWGVPAREKRVRQLSDDLQKADLQVKYDGQNPVGKNLRRFTDQIEKVDFVIVVGTPEYREKSDSRGHVLKIEMDLIFNRLAESADCVLPVLLYGDAKSALPPSLHSYVRGNLGPDKEYFVTVFDLTVCMYQLNMQRVIPIRDALSSCDFTMLSEEA